jgi:transglutaminase-like putative cysteine protease
MTFRFAHKLVAYIFSSLGLTALMLGTTFTGAVAFMVIVGFAVSWFAEPPLIDKLSYSRMWTYAVVALLFVQILRAFLGESALDAGVQYAAFLQLSRLSHRKRAADYQQITILAFLHLIAGTVLSSGLDYALVFVGFVLVMPWMLSLTHIRRELELRYAAHPQLLEAQLESPRIATRSFLLGTTLLALPLFVLTATLFVAFPRVGVGMLSNLSSRSQSAAGFGPDVQLGGFGTIRDDPTVVMRVKLPASPKSLPVSLPLRLRGTSFDSYRDGRWTRTPASGGELRRRRDQYEISRFPNEEDFVYQILLDPMDEPVIFLPEGTVSLQLPAIVRSGRERHRAVFYSPGMDLRHRDLLDQPLTYKAYVDQSESGLQERVSTGLLERYTELPEGYARVAELARRVAGHLPDARQQALAIEAFLRSGGGYRYTLEQPETGEQDPLTVFLFEAKAGHCEYFSTAMAVMMRALGHPARNVTGFLGADLNPYGGYYAVRNSNAHSWVEVLVDDRWQTFDPTPATGQLAAPPHGLLVKVRHIMDAMRVRWSEYVVEYNIQDQLRALRGIAAWYRSLRSKTAKPAAPEQQDEKSEASGIDWGSVELEWRWFLAVVIPCLMAIAWFRWRRLRRRRSSSKRRLPPDQDRALRLYAALERDLRKAGHPRPADVTPAEHASSLAELGFDAADEVQTLTEAYLGTRFGSAPLSANDYQRLRRLRRQVRNARTDVSG